MGEYARSLAIASAARTRWPAAAVHFMLSREAPYAAGARVPKTLLASSPTFHSAAVIERLEEFRPHVVVFDNAGRTAQLRAARRVGARIVFVSARARQRRKAFRWRWMALIDEHWIAYPQFIAGAPRWSERCKLAVLRRPVVRYLDVILPPPFRGEAPAAAAGSAARSGVLVVPGGGTDHPGASGAVGRFREAARTIAAGGWTTRFVGPADGAGGGEGAGDGEGAADSPPLHLSGPLPLAELAAAMRSAAVVVCNGGSTLLQAIACGAPCVAAPIARDQAQRIERCAAAGAAVAVRAEAAPIAAAALRLLGEPAVRDALTARAAGLALADGIGIALNALAGLLGDV